MKKLILSALVILFTLSLAAQSAMLKMNLEKNKIYRLKSVSEQTVSQTLNGNQQSTDTKVNYVMSLKILDITPEFMVTEIRFDTLITNSNAMGKSVNISSAVEGDLKSSETGDILSGIMNRLSRNSLYVKMDYTGKPMEIVNLKMLSDLILKDTSSITLTGLLGSAIKTQVVNSVSDNSLKTMIEGFTWFLPGKEISRGDNWTMTQKVNSGGMMLDINTTYHLDGISGDYANITAESSIKPSDNAAPIQSAGATVTYGNLQGLSKSTLVVDTRTGLLVSDIAKTHIAGELGISGPGFSMQMPMDINGETRVTAIK